MWKIENNEFCAAGYMSSLGCEKLGKVISNQRKCRGEVDKSGEWVLCRMCPVKKENWRNWIERRKEKAHRNREGTRWEGRRIDDFNGLFLQE